MKIHIISIANRPPRWTENAISDYVKTCPWKIEETRIPLLKDTKNTKASMRKMREAELLIKKIELLKVDFCIALDERGHTPSSVALSQKIDAWSLSESKLAFIIGGPDGLDDSISQRAQ